MAKHKHYHNHKQYQAHTATAKPSAYNAFDTSGWNSNRVNPRYVAGRGALSHEDSVVSQWDREGQIINARDLLRNSAIGRGLVNSIASLVIGSGIYPNATTSNEAWNVKAEKCFWSWSRKPEAIGLRNFKQLESLLVRHYITDGGVAVMLLDSGRIAPIEIDRFRPPKGQTRPYEIDANTGAISYWWIANRSSDGMTFDEPIRYEAQNILTMFSHERIDQIMPYSQLASASKEIRDISEICDNTRLQVKHQSIFAVAYKKGASGQGLGIKTRNEAQAQPVNGSAGAEKFASANGLAFVESDGNLNMLSPNTPNASFTPFVEWNIKVICMSLGMPFEFVLKYFQSSYSASRAVLIQAKNKASEWQTDMMQALLDPLYIWVVSNAIRDGVLDAPPANELTSFRWRLPSSEWIDQADAVQSELAEIKAGIRTLGDCAEKRGYTLEEVLEKKAQEIVTRNRIAKKYGIDPTQLSDIVIAGASNAIESKQPTQPIEK